MTHQNRQTAGDFWINLCQLRARPRKSDILSRKSDPIHPCSFDFHRGQEALLNSYSTHGFQPFTQLYLKPWDLRTWNLWALEAQHRSSSSQFSPETVPSRKASPSGTGHDWEEDFKGFGCSVHINSVSNLCTISRGNLKIPVWVLGFIFLVCVLSPCTKEADPLIKAFIKLAELSFSPSLSYPLWMLITVITQFILNEMLTMIPTDQQNKIKKSSGKKIKNTSLNLENIQ